MSFINFLRKYGKKISNVNDALNLSAENDHLNIVKYLVENGVDSIDDALNLSAENGHLDIVKYLVEECGADIYADNALKNSAYNGNLDIVKYLRKYVSNVNDALSLSAENDHLEIVKYLVENGADKHAVGNALKISAENGYLDIVKYLVDQGINNISDALRISAENDNLEIVKYLVEDCGVDKHVAGDALKISAQEGNLEIVKYLIETGIDVHTTSDALRISAEYGHLKIVKYLIEECGVDVHTEDDDALKISAENGYLDIVKYLVDQGADIHAGNDYALESSAYYGHLDIVKYLKSQIKGKLKKTVIKVSNLIKNKTHYYKWQKMCSEVGNKNILELQNLAKLHNISMTGKSKRQLCKDLAISYENQLSQKLKCNNETSILGDPIQLIPKPLLFTVNEGDKNYCFNIIELIELINKGNTRNPFTRNKLPLKEITDKFKKLEKILVADKMSLTNILDEIKNNNIMTKESILKLKIINLLAMLRYTPDINKIEKMTKHQIELMFNYLNQNPLLQTRRASEARGERTFENLINESIRILQIDDNNKDTRKTAYEVYLNEVV